MSMTVSPQFLVADLGQSIAYYRDRLGFEQKIAWQDFYASVAREGAEIHLKCAPCAPGERENRRQNNHIDAFLKVDDLDALYAEVTERGATIHQGLETHPWGARDFLAMDPDGYILCFAQDTDA